MTTEEKHDLIAILSIPSWDTREKALRYVSECGIEDTETRTPTQNKAFHKGCELIAEALNDAGLDIRHVIKADVEIPWNKEMVKEYLFRPVMKVMLDKESTVDLRKTGDIKPLWEVVMRHLMQHGLEYIPFPSMERQMPEYPEYSGPPNFDVSNKQQET